MEIHPGCRKMVCDASNALDERWRLCASETFKQDMLQIPRLSKVYCDCYSFAG
jgi:hypothetical protein